MIGFFSVIFFFVARFGKGNESVACFLFFEGFENQEIFLPKTCAASNEDEHSELSTAIFFGVVPSQIVPD